MIESTEQESESPPGTMPGAERPGLTGTRSCFHCGTHCPNRTFSRDEKVFCCQGCLIVFDLLTENGLADFYQLSDAAGVRVQAPATEGQFNFLDEPAVRQRLVDFADERITRVTFRLPAIHCIACIWLLENLFRLQPGLGQSQVNFLKKEAAITFENARVKLSEVATLLGSLGYEPELKFSDLEDRPERTTARRLWLQL